MYALFFQNSPFPFEYGSDSTFVGRMVSKLCPLPEEWDLLWREMQRRDEDSRVNGEILSFYSEAIFNLTKYITLFTGYRQRDVDTFEERRRAIMRRCQEGDDYQVDEYSDYDFESLRALSLTISALLKWEPQSRSSAQEALKHIEWVDYRNET